MMRLITPKRLKENEDAMWQLADEVLDTFLAPGEGEFIKGFASPFTLLVIADLLGIPPEDRNAFVDGISQHSGGGVGSTSKESLSHRPLEFLYGQFEDYVEDRRREPARGHPDRVGHRALPRRHHAQPRRRRTRRHQRLLGGSGDHGPAARHRTQGAR